MEKEKKQNLLIILSSIILVLLTAIVVYFIFFNKKDELKPVENPPVNEKENNNELVKELEKTNEKVFELFEPGKSLEEFKNQAKNYFTDDVINELVKYYNKDHKAICMDSATCGVGGGFFLENTDIYYRKLEIKDVKTDTIIANGIYGESATNITGKTEIIYQKYNGLWKISKYDIAKNNDVNGNKIK